MNKFIINPLTGRKILIGGSTYNNLVASGRRGFVTGSRVKNKRKIQKIPKPKKIKMKKQIKFTRKQEKRAQLSYELILKMLSENMKTIPSLATNFVIFLNKAKKSADNNQYMDATIYSFISFAILLSYSPTQLEQGFNSSRFNALKGKMGPLHTDPDVMLRWHQLKPKNKRKLNRNEIRAIAKAENHFKEQLSIHKGETVRL